MKTMIAALALVLLAASPTFAAHRHLQQGRDFYVPQSTYDPQVGYHYGMPTAPGEVNIPNPSGMIPGA
jgi:hypothetical protein